MSLLSILINWMHKLKNLFIYIYFKWHIHSIPQFFKWLYRIFMLTNNNLLHCKTANYGVGDLLIKKLGINFLNGQMNKKTVLNGQINKYFKSSHIWEVLNKNITNCFKFVEIIKNKLIILNARFAKMLVFSIEKYLKPLKPLYPHSNILFFFLVWSNTHISFKKYEKYNSPVTRLHFNNFQNNQCLYSW